MGERWCCSFAKPLVCPVVEVYKKHSFLHGVCSVVIRLSDGSSVSLKLFKEKLESLLSLCPVVASFDGNESPFV